MHERRRCLTFLLLGSMFLSCHVRAFQSESTPYSYLSVKKILFRNKCGIYLSVRLRTKWLPVGILLQALGFIFDNILAPKKNNFFCPAFVFYWGMSNGILKYILYFKNEALNISWISHYSSILVLKNSIQKKCYKNALPSLLMEIWSLSFSLKEEVMENIQCGKQSKCGWSRALHNSLLNAGIRCMLFW